MCKMERAIILKLAVPKYRLPYLDKVMLFNSQIRRPVACVVKRTMVEERGFSFLTRLAGLLANNFSPIDCSIPRRLKSLR